MVLTFHNEAYGGKRFFTLLERLERNPGRSLPVLEVYYACLALGFEGEMRVLPNGGAEAQPDRRGALRYPEGPASGRGRRPVAALARRCRGAPAAGLVRSALGHRRGDARAADAGFRRVQLGRQPPRRRRIRAAGRPAAIRRGDAGARRSDTAPAASAAAADRPGPAGADHDLSPAGDRGRAGHRLRRRDLDHRANSQHGHVRLRLGVGRAVVHAGARPGCRRPGRRSRGRSSSKAIPTASRSEPSGSHRTGTCRSHGPRRSRRSSRRRWTIRRGSRSRAWPPTNRSPPTTRRKAREQNRRIEIVLMKQAG